MCVFQTLWMHWPVQPQVLVAIRLPNQSLTALKQQLSVFSLQKQSTASVNTDCCLPLQAGQTYR